MVGHSDVAARKLASKVNLASPFTVPNSDHCERDAGMRLRAETWTGLPWKCPEF
jgi:hypothetical protein